MSNNSFARAQPTLISAAIRCFVMQRFMRMCYADAINRVLKEQSMVARRTEKKDFGLTTGWSEEDGTTTTYQPSARYAGSHRRIETGPVPRNVQPRTAAPASLNARRPSGVQPKAATPALEEFELLELDDLDVRGNPFAPRRSAASASVWNALGFAALFASVLVGRVIVDAGQNYARTGKRAAATEAPQPRAAAATAGSAGVGPDAQRNAAALDLDVAAREASPADGAKPDVSTGTVDATLRNANANPGDSAADAAKSRAPGGAHADPRSDEKANALPDVSAGGIKRDGTANAALSGNAGNPHSASGNAADAAQTAVPGSAKSDARSDNAGNAPLPSSSAGRAKLGGTALLSSQRGSVAESQSTAADPSSHAHSAQSHGSQPRAASSNWRDGPMEPATTNPRAPSNDWRDGPAEPATTTPRAQSKDWRDGPTEPATTNARKPLDDWRDGPTEPATTNAHVKSNDWRNGPMEPATSSAARAPSSDWRDGPMEPATASSAPPTAAGKALLGTLRINSRPWSQVFIDGRLIGNTPQMNLNLPAGRYSVRLSNPELGMSKTIVIQVAAGELVTRIESLE